MKFANFGRNLPLATFGSERVKEPISLKFETAPYFLKSCKKLLYSWTNKIGQHPGSSLKDMCLITTI